MDYFDDTGNVVDEIALPNFSDVDTSDAFYILDDGIVYDALTDTPIAFDDTDLFASYADGFTFGIDDMDMDFLGDTFSADTFDDTWYIDMIGDVDVSIDPDTGATFMQEGGAWYPVNFDDYGNLTTLIDSQGDTFDIDTPNITVIDGPGGDYVVLANNDGSVNITDPFGDNYTAQSSSALVTAAVNNTPGVRFPSTPGAAIDNFFALAANIVQTYAQYKTQQNLQATGAYRNTTGGYVSSGGQFTRTNAQGTPIRAASGGIDSKTMLIIAGVVVAGIFLMKRKG